MLDTFKKYLVDEMASEMYISGQAGTGKTTGLSDLVQYCIDNKIEYTVCAYTHKACGILASKLPAKAVINTLHKFLKKRPTVNEHAVNVKHLSSSKQQGVPESTAVLFIDEYSMIGERDYTDIGNEQWGDQDAPLMKVVYLGDPNQLPPVDDTQAVYPGGKYNIKLTKIWRTACDNPLIDTLTALVSYIEGTEPQPLLGHSTFIRNTVIEREYALAKTEDKIILAFTNEAVQRLNAVIEGISEPEIGSALFSPTLKQYMTYLQPLLATDISHVIPAFGDEPLIFGSKYKTLERLIAMPDINYAVLGDQDGNEEVYAYIFGHYNYKIALEELGSIAVRANKNIEAIHKIPAKEWAMSHKGTALAKHRSKAWADYLTFKNCVICIDFTHAMTIHKSQGSTFDTVLIDTQDLSKCADKNYMMYLRLLYVAISRASQKVYTN